MTVQSARRRLSRRERAFRARRRRRRVVDYNPILSSFNASRSIEKRLGRWHVREKERWLSAASPIVSRMEQGDRNSVGNCALRQSNVYRSKFYRDENHLIARITWRISSSPKVCALKIKRHESNSFDLCVYMCIL